MAVQTMTNVSPRLCLHMGHGQPRPVLRGSANWCPYQPDRIKVRGTLGNIFKMEGDIDRDISLTKNDIDRDISLAKNYIDRDISLAKNDIDRDISLVKNDIDREGIFEEAERGFVI